MDKNTSVQTTERQIMQQLKSIDSDVAYLEKEIEQLEHRLEPILPPENFGIGEPGEAEDPTPYIERSQITKQLQSFSDALMILRRRVSYLNQKIEI